MKRIYLIAALVLLAVVLASGWLLGRGCRKPPAPPVTVVRTIPVPVPGKPGETRVDTIPDDQLAAEFTKLRAELDGHKSAWARLTRDYLTLAGYTGTLQDSLMAAKLAATGLLCRVEARPRSVRWTSYRADDGRVAVGEASRWRSRWTLTAGRDGPVLVTSRLPFDVGFVAAAGAGWSPLADTTGWPGAAWARAGVEVRRDWLTGGVGWQTGPGGGKVFAEATARIALF
jgi:hypothetical protein